MSALFTIDQILIGFSDMKILFSLLKKAYALHAQPHVASGLVTSNSVAHKPRFNAVFLCVLFGHTVSMVRLNGDTFEYASDLQNLLTNPVQSSRPYLVISGSTSINPVGVSHD